MRSEKMKAGLTSEAIVTVGSDGTILFITRSIEQLLGFDAGELVGRNVVEFVKSSPVSFRRLRAK